MGVDAYSQSRTKVFLLFYKTNMSSWFSIVVLFSAIAQSNEQIEKNIVNAYLLNILIQSRKKIAPLAFDFLHSCFLKNIV